MPVVNPHVHTEQEILNSSFDETFGVSVSELVRRNEAGTAIEYFRPASETTQETLSSLIETLQELNQRLTPLAGAMANTAQLRAVVTGAVTATGGGYITSAQSIAEKALAGISYPEKVAITNMAAVHSNIINVVT